MDRIQVLPRGPGLLIDDDMRRQMREQIFGAYGIPKKFLGLPVEIDENLPPTVIGLRSETSVVWITNLKP